MNKTRRLFHVMLIAIFASLAWAPAAQAAYSYKKKVTVDRSRVAVTAVSPPAGFGYMKSITIDNTQVGGTSNLTDFPVLVSIQNDAALKTTANGGRVTDNEGDDLVFYAPNLTTVLDYEVEQYDGATGTLVAWVRLPVLAFDVDTVFYLAYGNDPIDDSLENEPGVWDSNFKGVWHLKEATDATNIDSTSNANHGTPEESPAAAPGKIAGALDFEGANQTRVALGTDSSLDLSGFTNWTMSTWVKPSANYVDSKYPALYAYGDWEVALDIAVQDGPEEGRIEYWLKDKTGLWSDTAVTVNTWNHVVIVHTPTTTFFYLNGVADGSDNNTSIGQDNSGSYIGGYPDYNDGDVMGVIDEVRISDTNRSAGWVTTGYNNQNDPGGFMTIEEAGLLGDFPVLVSIQNDAQLKTEANGGQVTDAEGDDIIFTADAAGLSPLNHEVEAYDGTSGTLVAWVRLPSLAASADTVFYLHYGDSGVSTPQGNAPGVWDSNFKGVWHLAEDVTKGQTSGIHLDSTANGNDGTQDGNEEGTGNIADGQIFDGNNDSITIGNVIGSANAVTVSAWVKHDRLRASTIEDYIDMSDEVVLRHDGINSLGQLHFYMTVDGDNYRHLRVNGALTDDTWYHVAGTWDGTTQRVYLDGRQMDSQVPGGTLDTPEGGTISAATPTMDGTIDEARISNTARSAGWITTGYNNQRWPNKAEWPDLGFITVERSVCDLAAPVTCGSTTAGSIETPGAWDAFKVTLAADTWLELYTTGTTDTYGHLYDENCDEIAQDDTVDYNFSISQPAAEGTYYVQVRHASESGTGDYELNVACGDDDHGDSIDEATAVDCGSPAAGEIQSAADKDYFKVVFWGTGILTASTSGDTNTQGTLRDEADNIIAADDDSGVDSNFEIEQTIGPGVYYVVVSSSAGSGDYTLQVDCEYTPVITATAEYGGSICKSGSSPCESGAVGVAYDTDQTFTITPAAGNTVRDVWVDGEWIGAVTSHKFQKVQKDHKIVAVFNADFENCVDIPDIPLDAWYRSAPANVMFVLDDSGSMDWEFMTTSGDGLFDDYYRYVFDDPGDNLYGRVLPANRRMQWQSQWAGHNKLYYDPAVTYQPWPNHVDGDPATTLDPAHPDTPRSHPMVVGTTFDLNGTYHQYTDDTIANIIIVNDQDSDFSKTPGGGGGQTELSTGFEGADWDDGFENNGTTDWNEDDHQQNEGDYSALATKNEGGYLTSDDLDTSDADAITVDFWIRWDKAEDNEITLNFYDGSDYDLIADLKTLGAKKNWLHYRNTFTASQYFRSDFRIRFDASLSDNKGKVWLDDVVVTKDTGAVSWELATGSDQAYGSDPDDPGEYFWTAADGDYTATWTPDIPVNGKYDVYARWHADANHSENVPYTVNYAGGVSETVTVNQRLSGGIWVLLGSYQFVAGKDGNVTLSHTRSGDDDRVCADAIKFVPAGAIDAIDITRAHYYAWSASDDKPYLVVLDGAIAYYAVNDAVVHGGDGDNKVDSGELSPTATPPADVKTARLYAQERQNFANWYQFYRRRELAATAAVGNVISDLKGVQVGLYSINGNVVLPALPVKSAGIDKSKSLLQALYNLKVRAQGTPLRRGLREVGNYFANSSDMIGSSPYAPAENGGACQQAFTIVMTDGFWNGSTPSVGNTDGDDNTTFDGGGRADIYSNTLADVAMKYYETDLHTGLDDDVPDNAVDTATHQHMVTYAVSFGRVGSLDPADYDIANGSYPAWPDPRYIGAHKIDDLWHAAVNGRGEFLNAASPTELVDSLLAITDNIQSRITSSSSVSVNGDPLYQELDEHIRMYQATYRSDSWVGDVSAYKVDPASGEVAATPDWSAADELETLTWDSDRTIATYDGSQGIPFRYDLLSTAQQLALGSDLVDGSPAELNADKILKYLRGDRSNEEQNSGSGAFRDRFQVLGDIVHSSPVYHNGMLYAGGNDGMLHAFDSADGEERFAYVPDLAFGDLSTLADPEYSHKYFVDLSPTIKDVTLSGQAKTILVGGLGKGGKGYYALDITAPESINNEDELAARVLWEFPDPHSDLQGYLAYENRIDTIAVGDVIHNADDTATGTVVAIPAADMAEGTGILDITFAPGNGMFQDGEDLYVGAGVGMKVAEADGRLYDPYMGYSYSRPVIVRSNDSTRAEWLVIFGNGYNSSKSHAVLYVLNLATGELIRRLDTGVGNCNGLSSPIAIDIDSNGTADYVYAGDLQGNLWKFELHKPDAADWEVAYFDTDDLPAPVFQAKNFSDRPQPITSKPDVMYHCDDKPGYLVVFGTGRYLTELDLESSESNSIYGIWDYGDDDDDREYLGSFERADTPQLLNPHLDGVTSRSRVKLLEQTVEPGTWTTVDGRALRVITDHSPVWGTVADNDIDQDNPQPDPGSLIPETVHAGWYFDLPNTGELAVSDVMIRDGKVLVISFTPGNDPCGYGGSSIFHILDACSGARPSSSVFGDLFQVLYDGNTIDKNSDSWKEPSGIEFSGRLQPPVILRKGNTELHYLSSSNGDVYKQEVFGPKLGIFYWMQVE